MTPNLTLDKKYINFSANLPYGLEVKDIVRASEETYRLIYGLNNYLIKNGFRPLEQLLLGNSLSGILSEFIVKNIASASDVLEANIKVGGHPDLLPKNHYTSNSVLKGKKGLEVKASIHKGGWQGHNPENCWLMIFRYSFEDQNDKSNRLLTFTEILCAKLSKSDWAFSGRKGSSRRTPTASITSSGSDKLRNNFIYRIPAVGVGKYKSILANNL